MGTNDLVKELYAEHVPGRAPVLTGLSLAVLAARAAGMAILDGVYNDVRDARRFAAECRQGRELGFDGKTLIHPGQVEVANEAFAPSDAGGRATRAASSRRSRRHGAGTGVVTVQRPDDREPARRDARSAPSRSPTRSPASSDDYCALVTSTEHL